MKKDKAKLIDWKVAADGSKIILFEVDGPELFTMGAERFGLLLNADYVRGLIQEAAQERLYPQEWGLEKYVEAQRLIRKGLGMEQIASLWGAPDAAVRTFYSAGLQKFGRDHGLTEAAAARQGSSKAEKDTCLSLQCSKGDESRAGEDFLVVPRIAAVLKEKGPGGTADEFNLNVRDLQDWIEKNKRYLALFGYKD